MVVVDSSSAPDALPEQSIVCHDVRNPAQRSEVLVRKGASLGPPDVVPLLARGVGELHLAVPDPDDVGEDDAAQRLAKAIVGPNIDCDAPHFGQVTFRSGGRGVFRVGAARLTRVNALDEVLLLTGDGDRPVETGDAVGVVKCAPLFLPERALLEVEAIAAAEGPVVEVQLFQSARVGFLAPAGRLRGGAFDRAQQALGAALEWYGSSLSPAIAAEATVDGLADAYRQAQDSGAGLIFAAGASGTDPCDIVFEGLRRAGGQVSQLGIPAEPGTACWIGELGATPVLGLASCELFGQPGALDLLLPRLLTGESLDRGLLRRIALGGLLNGPTRIAPFHARTGNDD
jgi:hypothetical protein